MERAQPLQRIGAGLAQGDILTDNFLDVCLFADSGDVAIGNSACHDSKSRPLRAVGTRPPKMVAFGDTDLRKRSPEPTRTGLAEVG